MHALALWDMYLKSRGLSLDNKPIITGYTLRLLRRRPRHQSNAVTDTDSATIVNERILDWRLIGQDIAVCMVTVGLMRTCLSRYLIKELASKARDVYNYTHIFANTLQHRQHVMSGVLSIGQFMWRCFIIKALAHLGVLSRGSTGI
jgi:hypothetical protein